MEISNKVEYRIIRDEMQRLKNCITTYLGYVIGGFGASIVSIYAVKDIMSNVKLVSLALLLLAITMSFVLYVIVYKFNSHNRYAGYCKLLNQEQLSLRSPSTHIGDVDVMSWETCVDRLRDSDFVVEPFRSVIDDLVRAGIIQNGDISRLKSVLGSKKAADRHKYWKGFLLVCRVLRGRVTTRSWQFPIFVMSVFISICAVYVSLSLYTIHTSIPALVQGILTGSDRFGIVYMFLLGVLAVMWMGFIGHLHKTMDGSCTVDGYCWRFLPVRYAFIVQKTPAIDYKLITLKHIL